MINKPTPLQPQKNPSKDELKYKPENSEPSSTTTSKTVTKKEDTCECNLEKMRDEKADLVNQIHKMRKEIEESNMRTLELVKEYKLKKKILTSAMVKLRAENPSFFAEYVNQVRADEYTGRLSKYSARGIMSLLENVRKSFIEENQEIHPNQNTE